MPTDSRVVRRRPLPALGLLTALLLFLFTLPSVSTGTASAELPPAVAAALREPDCKRLLALLDAYRDRPGATVEALERAILMTPGCGAVQGRLVQVTPLQGANFFDYRQVLGLPAGEPQPPVIGPGYTATYAGDWTVLRSGEDLTCTGFRDLSGNLRLPEQIRVAFTRGTVRIGGPAPLPTLTGPMDGNRFKLRTTRTGCPAGAAHFVATGAFEAQPDGGIALTFELRVQEPGQPPALYRFTGRER